MQFPNINLNNAQIQRGLNNTLSMNVKIVESKITWGKALYIYSVNENIRTLTFTFKFLLLLTNIF